MRSVEGKVGRVFVIRLDDGDRLPDCIERFAAENGVSVGQAIMVGAVGGGEVVVGPRRTEERPPQPMLVPVDGAHEIVGIGVLAPDEKGRPLLHLHAALGRSGNTVTGCLRYGVDTWLVGEVILYEVVGADVTRMKDPQSGFVLLEPRSSLTDTPPAH